MSLLICTRVGPIALFLLWVSVKSVSVVRVEVFMCVPNSCKKVVPKKSIPIDVRRLVSLVLVNPVVKT